MFNITGNRLYNRLKEIMKYTPTHKESKEIRKERIALSGRVKTQVLPNKKGYTRKTKHKGF